MRLSRKKQLRWSHNYNLKPRSHSSHSVCRWKISSGGWLPLMTQPNSLKSSDATPMIFWRAIALRALQELETEAESLRDQARAILQQRTR